MVGVICRAVLAACMSGLVGCAPVPSGPQLSPIPDGVGEPPDAAVAIEWLPFSTASWQVAKRRQKPAFVYWHAPWCDWCRQMDRGTLDDRLVVGLVNERFTPMVVDVSAADIGVIDDSVYPPRPVSGADMAHQFGVTTIPAGFIIGPSRSDGWSGPVVVDSFTGYMTRSQMLSWLSGAVVKAQDPPR